MTVRDDNLSLQRLRALPRLTMWWLFHRMTQPWRATPAFIIAGAQKCGTSSLFAYLSEHPQVFPAFRKEVKYFEAHYPLGEAWYRANFPLRVKLSQAEGITGEASPNYLLFPEVPGRIAVDLPEVRLIILLRNPVERAYSHYQHMRRRKKEWLPFGAAIAVEAERLAGELEKTAADPDHPHEAFINFSYLARGRYMEQLARFGEHFPREQMLILKSEDFYRNPAQIYAEVLNFLELPGWELPAYPAKNQGSYTRIDPAVRRRLNEYFRPHNQQLYEFLGRDLGWQ